MALPTLESTSPAQDTLNHKAVVQSDTDVDSSCESDGSSEEHAAEQKTVPALDSSLPAKTLRQKLEPRAWSLFVIACIVITAPLLVFGTAMAMMLNRLIGSRSAPVQWNGKTAIVTGGKMTKAYTIIKHLKAQGCRVVLVETSKYWMVASRFSRAVDRFVTVPIPEKEPEAYLESLRQLAKEESADVFVPVCSPVASRYDARVASVLPEGCHTWSLTPEMTEDLDDKVVFCKMASDIGLTVPQTCRMNSVEQVREHNAKLAAAALKDPKQPRFIFKNLQYDSMHRLDLFTLPCEPAELDAYLAKLVADGVIIDEANPWAVQTFIVGQEYSTCAFAKDGDMLAFTDNEASISCFNYKPQRSALMREWVGTFCSKYKLSGIVCIDFMAGEDGIPYTIECNPRASSNLTNFHNHPDFGKVIFDPTSFQNNKKTLEPLSSAVETYWLFSEVYYAIAKPGLSLELPKRLLNLAKMVFCNNDAYFDADDPMPFLALHLIHIPMLLLRNVYTGNKWAKIDPCIGKMTEENGD